MTIEQFARACEASRPPAGLAGPLLALWWDARGDWDRAHKVAQEAATQEGSLVHAYLHRKEGDPGNAGYWYSRAGRQPHRGSLEQEWKDIAAELCGQS